MAESAFPLTERRKIDEKGAYLHFPGITVVCDLALESRASLSHLPDLLKASPLLGPYLAPLPVTSYHVTLLDICCQYKLGLDDEAWCSFCAHPRWAAAAKLLRGISGERGEESPEAPFVLRLAVERLEISHGCVGLVLRACGETPEHPSAVAVGRRLEGLLEAQPQKWPWHLTLAYGLNGLRRTAESEPTAVEAERHALEEQIRRALPDELRFAQAELCRFEDMTAFVPWDGEAPATERTKRGPRGSGAAADGDDRCGRCRMGTVSNFDLGKRAEAPLEKLLELGKKPLLGGEAHGAARRDERGA
ncbi:40S ribosomal protein S11 [Durusdinium trenchii]|uniref:40S ribosomal protein S11 n=1 Tax=Durusdinium trenchii TaxID=1381693 RepID=A0ABP0KD74_9DINO